MSKESFLARVREAAERGRAHRVHTADVPPEAGYVGGGDDVCGRLGVEVEAVGGHAHVVENFTAARGALAEIMAAAKPESALCWQHAVLDAIDLDALLTKQNVARVDYGTLAQLSPEDQRKAMLAADIGITSVSFAIAETGSLALMSAPGRERVASLVPPLHVAIVSRDQILPDLFDLFNELEATGLENLPSNLAFVTGPSKTGDLELKLTTGVHGPGEWHVIVIRESLAVS